MEFSSCFQSLDCLPPRPGLRTLAEVDARFVYKDEGVEDEALVASYGVEKRFVDIYHVTDAAGAENSQLESVDLFLRRSQHPLSSFFARLYDRVVQTVEDCRLRVGSSSGKVVEMVHRREKKILAFHWTDDRVAVGCTQSHSIVILNLHDERKLQWERPPLRSSKMRNISALQYRPYTGSTLAVGCTAGIAIWRGREVSYLTQDAVVSLQWAPSGNYLAAMSYRDNICYAWDVGLKEAQPLLKVYTTGWMLCWSPSFGGNLLAAGSTRNGFSLVDSYWTESRWGNMLGTVSTCCWSHDGRILLVAPSGEAVIHAFQLVEEINASPRFLRSHSTAAVRTKYADSELAVCVGGIATAMAWDPKGERLAVIFDMMSSDEGGDTELVAIYEAKVHPSFAMTLVGWVRGPAGCGRPIDVAFKPHFEEGALLMVVWEDAISFVQMYFQGPSGYAIR